MLELILCQSSANDHLKYLLLENKYLTTIMFILMPSYWKIWLHKAQLLHDCCPGQRYVLAKDEHSSFSWCDLRGHNFGRANL